MRLREIGLSLLGSAVVYVAMAACSSGGGSSSGVATRVYGTGGGGGSPGGASSAGPRLDSGIFDALTDPVATASADPTDGSRLKATYLVGADGSKAYVPGVWFDSMRNEDCAFSTGGDGQQRCLPNGVTSEEFSDAQCTKPILSVSTGCTAPTYVLGQVSSTTCTSATLGTNIYTVGAASTPSGLYVQSGATCYSAGPPASGFTYYTVGAEVAPTSFVAATAGHD